MRHTHVTCLVEDKVEPAKVALPDKDPLFVQSKYFPRLPCVIKTPKAARVRLAELIKESQSPADVWIQKLSDTKRDIELHLTRLADEATSDVGSVPEIDVAYAEQGQFNELRLRRLLKLWEEQKSDKPQPIVNGDAPRATDPAPQPIARPRVVVLGSGWGAHAVAKVIDTKKFDAVFISPRSYFIFTPMLASSSVGTVEYRSICEPMRSSNPFIDFYEAASTGVDVERKVVKCTSVGTSSEFEVPYDFLVLGIGMKSNTFNTPGVEEHCFFLKEVEDAKRLRAGIVDAFEQASLPGLSEDELRRRLTFVVVGGGPTGVEFSGELFDFLQQDLKRYYPRLVPFVSTKMLQSGEGILEQFDGALQSLALRSLRRDGTEVVLGARVVEVTADSIKYKTKDGSLVSMGCGVRVWACGNQPRPLARELIAQLQRPEDAPRGRIATDAWLRVLGVPDGSVFAIGDCAEVETGALPQTGQVAAQEGAYVARILNDEALWPPADSPPGPARGGAWAAAGAAAGGGAMPGSLSQALAAGADAGDEVCRAVVASGVAPAGPFQFVSLGILAYIGGNSALAQVDVSAAAGMGDRGSAWTVMTGGWAGWLLWRSVYLTKQVAFRNRVLVLFDWVKSKVFGRDIACL